MSFFLFTHEKFTVLCPKTYGPEILGCRAGLSELKVDQTKRPFKRPSY